ncbi:MAG: dipeptide epimerase [Candidatus Omnitrophica bacterium]|nr:dipeptide epimerase [Candidatus Omnitrophota bacterium]
MIINEVGLYLIRIPFRFSFRHARASRKETLNLIVTIKLDNGIKGVGESIPREYVTGETADGCFNFLEKDLMGRLKGLSFDEKESFLKGLADALDGVPQAARCAVEIACLDAFSRFHNLPLYGLFTQQRDGVDKFCYSGIMSGDGLSKTLGMALFFKFYGFRDIKLKVGFKNDINRLRALRSIVGGSRDIRLDANGAWKVEEAIERIKAMAPYNISMVEQPVGPGDPTGFKRVTEESQVKTMADESLRTPVEAEELAREKICHSFNIRLSKCGGFLNSIKIAEIAEKYGLSFQIGCHVGETGILGAAGRHLAACLPGARYLEGSYSRFLLTGDIVNEDVNFGRGGMAKKLDGPGLGIEIHEKRFSKYVYKKTVLSRKE